MHDFSTASPYPRSATGNPQALAGARCMRTRSHTTVCEESSVRLYQRHRLHYSETPILLATYYFNSLTCQDLKTVPSTIYTPTHYRGLLQWPRSKVKPRMVLLRVKDAFAGSRPISSSSTATPRTSAGGIETPPITALPMICPGYSTTNVLVWPAAVL